jgi:hypothetical protein
MKPKIKTLLFYLCFFCLATGLIYADGPSGLMLMALGVFSIIGLIIVNLIIAPLEALLISKIFETKLPGSIWIIFLANIASAIIGLGITGVVSLGANIYDMKVFIALFVVLFVLTVYIEWPFFSRLLEKNGKDIKQAFKASLIANACSYVLLITTVLIYRPLAHL